MSLLDRNRRDARKTRNRMSFTPAEAESYEYAQDTEFGNLVRGIHDDPTGRGPARPVAPLSAEPAGLTFDAARRQMELEANEPRRMQEAGLEDTDPLADFSVPEVENRERKAAAVSGRAAHASPVGLMSGGQEQRNPWKVEIGDAVITREPPAPPEPGDVRQNALSVSNGQGGNPTATPEGVNYGRVKPGEITDPDAGPAPEDEETSQIAGAGRALAPLLMALGGRGEDAMAAGADSQRRSERARDARTKFGQRQGELAREADKERRGESRYADAENFQRSRAENQDTAARARDAYDREVSEETRSMRREDRDPARLAAANEAEFGDWKRRKDYEADLAAKARRAKGGGAGNLPARQQAAFEAGMATLRAQHPDGVPPAKEALLRQATIGNKNPEQAALGVTSKTDAQLQTGKAGATKVEAARAEAQQGASRTLQELTDMERLLERRLAQGKNVLPGSEAASGPRRAVAGMISEFSPGGGSSQPAPIQNKGESDSAYQKRVEQYEATVVGPSGYTAEESKLNNLQQIAGRAEYYASTQNSANLMAEQGVADATFKTNNTTAGALQEVRRRKARLQATLQSGAIPRDADGNRLDVAPEQPVPAQRVRASDGTEIELVDP